MCEVAVGRGQGNVRTEPKPWPKSTKSSAQWSIVVLLNAVVAMALMAIGSVTATQATTEGRGKVHDVRRTRRTYMMG